MQSSHDSIVLPKVRGGALPRGATSDITSLPASSPNTARMAKKISPIGLCSPKRKGYYPQIPTTHIFPIPACSTDRRQTIPIGIASASATGACFIVSPSLTPYHPPIVVQPPTSPPRRRDSSSASASGSTHQRPGTNHSKSRRRRPRRHNHRRANSSGSDRAATAAGSPAAATSGHGNNKSPFHSGLQDILQGVFGHGAQGPTMNEVEKLADELGDLIQGALMEKLVAELRAGLLEKLLIEYLEELVTGVVIHGLDRANKKREDKDGKDHRGAADWKKTALKRAIKIFMERITKKSP
ncbi:hypothetical protein PG990_006820 [Apiospora arundinis]